MVPASNAIKLTTRIQCTQIQAHFVGLYAPEGAGCLLQLQYLQSVRNLAGILLHFSLQLSALVSMGLTKAIMPHIQVTAAVMTSLMSSAAESHQSLTNCHCLTTLC